MTPADLGRLGKSPWKVLAVRERGGWMAFGPQPLPDLSASSSCSRRNNVSLGDEKHPFVQALIAMLLCQVNEWQAGIAAGHSQCQAAKPAALGQPGPAGLGVLPTSVPHWGPCTGTLGQRGPQGAGEESLQGERGVGCLGGSQTL